MKIISPASPSSIGVGGIRSRLEFLASVFAIECLTFAVMSNQLHLVLRSRADVAATWSDDEVARRWLRLFPPPPQQRRFSGDTDQARD
ncbi:hypothetical protein [Stieleria mannarensis]|uniref:hypothetical protein n=1 Tax=Stieleria mannarensis TaxID=2755585 RepID=UPI00256FF98D|nr:hypothetical protein [Rhodopirellula sp. JC639]